MSGKAWFEQGYGGVDKEQEKRDTGGGPKRWWMAPGTMKQLVFIDDAPICFNEHAWKTEGSKFPQFGTCLANITQEPCPGCGARGVGKADYVGHLTAVDVTGYTTKEGKTVQYELVEYAPKLKVMNKLKTRKSNKGSLIGQLYSVSRADENAPNTGDDFDEIKPAKMDVLYKLVTYRGKNLSEMIEKANGQSEEAKKLRRFLAHNFQIPETGDIPAEIPAFNYQKLHEPMEVAEFRRAVAGAVGFTSGGSSGGSSSGSTGGTSTEEVPF